MLTNLPSSQACVAKQGRPSKAQVSPGLCFPRFAKYYRDGAGVEFRTLMKAYGIRFDVMVNGRVCELGRPRAGQTCWEGPGWSPWGSCCPPASLTAPVSLCASGREVQHHPHSHQRGLGGGAYGCCEYLSPPSPLPSEHRWGEGDTAPGELSECPRRSWHVSADAGKEASLGLHTRPAAPGGRDCLSFFFHSQRGICLLLWSWGSLGYWTGP